MSIRYKIAKCVLRILGIKKIFQLPVDELTEKAERLNKNRHFYHGREIPLFIYPKRNAKVRKSNPIFLRRRNDHRPG